MYLEVVDLKTVTSSFYTSKNMAEPVIVIASNHVFHTRIKHANIDHHKHHFCIQIKITYVAICLNFLPVYLNITLQFYHLVPGTRTGIGMKSHFKDCT